MKFLKKNIIWLPLAILLLIIVRCMTIEEIIHPDNAKVNSDVDITVRIKIDAETDGNSKLAFGILVPKSWNVAKNASLTVSTIADFGANVVTDEPMTVIGAGELNPSDAQPWSTSFQSKFGVLGNTGPVEWVVFESGTTFQINDTKPDQKVVNATVKIRIHAGDRAVKFYMGYTFCGKAFGFNSEKYPDTPVLASKLLEVTGGNEPMWDYTAEPPISFVPATFGFGDIFAVKYNEPLSMTEGGLKGGNVYLLGKVKYYDNGVLKEKNVDETSTKTLMEDLGNTGIATTWQKYIFPKDYFGLPKDAVITEIGVRFSNQDKSIVMLDNETDDNYIVEETCK
jgi:hypothetical protein